MMILDMCTYVCLMQPFDNRKLPLSKINDSTKKMYVVEITKYIQATVLTAATSA